MAHTTTTTNTTFTSNDTAMGNGNKKFTSHSFSSDDKQKHPSKLTNNKEVTQWSSIEVQHWIKQQCKKFDLKKATTEKFELNGQALVLLTKHDFLRRSPDGGEILYYELQRLINPKKNNSARSDQASSKNKSSGQHPRIVEVSSDDNQRNYADDPSSPKPIVEEPDDPPAIRRSYSDTEQSYNQRQRPHSEFFNRANARPTVFTMPAGAAAAYLQQQQQQFITNALLYALQRHPNLLRQHPQFIHPHLLHQANPMMSTAEILIELIDDLETIRYILDGASGLLNSTNFNPQESLYLVTMNGQQYIMTEGHIRQLVTEVHHRQSYHENLQRQELLWQQQQLFQQQQQQQYFHQQQQQQQRHFPQPSPPSQQQQNFSERQQF